MSKSHLSLLLSIAIVTLAHSTAGAQQASIAWRSDLNSARQEAAQTGRNLLVHFWAPWCGPCRRLETTVFNQPNVAATLQQGVVPVKLNADEFPNVARAFGVDRLPTDVIVRADGTMLAKFASPQDPSEYVTQIAAFTGPTGSPNASTEQLAAAGGGQPSRTAPVQSAYANLHSPRAETVPFRWTPDSPLTSPGSSAPGTYVGGAPAEDQWRGGGASPTVMPPANSYATLPENHGSPIAGTADGRYAAAVQPSRSYASEPAAAAFQQPPTGNPAGQAAATPSGTALAAGRYSPPAGSAQMQPAVPVQSQPSVTVAQAGANGGLGSSANSAAAAGEASPAVGLEGFCPVTLKRDQRWVAGDKRFGVIHRGCLYLFAGPEQQQQFWSNPDHYSPVLSGIDPVLALDNGATVPGRREHGVEYNGLVYLFSSESTLQHFSRNPGRYAGGVRQAMQAGVGTTLR